jgi:lipopolysaccharide biosynthesis protein
MKDVCLFAHFDRSDLVDEYVLRYLKRIRELNFSIVFISASRLGARDIERVRADCCDVIVRENAGLDFGSWSAAIAKHRTAIQGRLLLANDSVYGPVGSLADALARLTSRPADFYGLAESVEIAPHLQSWFLLFEPWVVQHAVFANLLMQPFSTMSKPDIIANGEIGLSQRLIEAGFRYQALYLIDREGLSAHRHTLNPMHLLWRELLFDDGIPFVKVELLRDNPLGVENAETILQALEPLDPPFCDIIRSHLKRTSRGRAPQLPKSRIGRWARHQRYAMLRYGHQLGRTNRRVAEGWNLVKLELLTQSFRVARGLKDVRRTAESRMRAWRTE